MGSAIQKLTVALDSKVKSSSSDTSSGYLDAKVDGTTLEILSEQLHALAITDTDGDTKVTANEDYITLETAGNERMRILSDGKIGIGTDTPDELLHVEDSGVDSTPAIKLENDTIAWKWVLDGSDSDILKLLETTDSDASALEIAQGTQVVSFTQFPITPSSAPTTDYQTANKKYVDDNVGISNLLEDTTPQLGGDLDLNGKNIDFPSTPNISDCLDEDDMNSDSATALATQQSIKKYVDDNAGGAWTQVAQVTPTAQSTITISSSLSPGKRYCMIVELRQNTTAATHSIFFNNDTAGGDYRYSGYGYDHAGSGDSWFSANANEIFLHDNNAPLDDGNATIGVYWFSTDPSDNTWVYLRGYCSYEESLARFHHNNVGGDYDGASNLSRVDYRTTAGTFTGTITLYEIT